MKKPAAIITSLALASCGGSDPVSMRGSSYTSSKVGDKVVYTRPDGSQFTYNFLGLLYEVMIENGQLVDKTDYSKYSYKNLKKYILNDKKVSKGKLNLILINQKGVAFKTDKYNLNNLKKALN